MSSSTTSAGRRNPGGRRRRASAALSLSTLAAFSVVLPQAAAAQAADPATDYAAATSAGLLDATLLGVAGLSAGTISVADSRGALDSSSPTTAQASATNLDGTLLTAVPLNVLSTTQQAAPPDNPDGAAEDIVPAFTTPLLGLGISNAEAAARARADGACLEPSVALTRSTVSTASASVVPIPLAGGGALVDLPGEVAVSQSTSLVPTTPGSDRRSVVASAEGTAVDLSLLGQIAVKVTGAPNLTATASGAPGGADVTWEAPLVTVEVAGTPYTLPVDGSPLDLVLPSNPLLELELGLGQVRDVVEAADGTAASATASVLTCGSRCCPCSAAAWRSLGWTSSR